MTLQRQMHPHWREFVLPQFAFVAAVGVRMQLVDLTAIESAGQKLLVEAAVVLSLVSILGFAAYLRLPRHPGGMAVPIVDIIVVGLIGQAVQPASPLIGVPVVLPLIWLACLASRTIFATGLVVSVVVTVYPTLRLSGEAASTSSLVETLAVTVGSSALALIIRAAVRYVRMFLQERSNEAQSLRFALAAALRREQTWRAAADAVGAAIEVHHPNGQITRNASAAGLAAWTASALPVFGPDRTTPVAVENQITARALRGESTVGRLYWVGEPGNQIAVAGSYSLADAPDGSPLGTVIVTADVTALVEAREVRDSFLATVSHELKTPLTSIMGHLDTLDAERLGITEPVAVIERNALRLLALITDLIDAARREVKVSRFPVDVAALALTVVDEVRGRTDSRGPTLTLHSAPTIIADVDPAAFRRILENLLSNAIKFSRQSGGVQVIIASDRNELVLRVADDGMGIPPGERESVFERFYRGSAARAAALPGAGLGLAIVRSLVDAQSGAVQIDAAPTGGTVVTVRLPRELSVAVLYPAE